MNKLRYILLIFLILIMASCISVSDLAMQEIGNILSSDGSGSTFTGDNDPELVREALPLTMKLYELILSEQPENAELNFATGKNFVLYANAFLQTPAGQLPDEEWEENQRMMNRAKKMYLRGRDYVLKSLELSYPGFSESLEEDDIDDLLLKFTVEDVPRLYWGASAWIGAFSCDPFDFELGVHLAQPLALLMRALELDPDYNNGSLHSILISVHASLPESYFNQIMVSSPTVLAPFLEDLYRFKSSPNDKVKRVEYHFKETVRASKGLSPSPYISYAEGVAVKTQDYDLFKELLNEAMSIVPDNNPDNRLETIIYQEKAQWLLDNAELFFILDEEFYD